MQDHILAMRSSVWTMLIILLLVPPDSVQADAPQVWFRPRLTLDKNPVCKVVLDDARQFFLTNKQWSGDREPAKESYVKSLIEISGMDGSSGEVTLPGGRYYYSHRTNWANCCMGEQTLLLSKDVISNDDQSARDTALTPMEGGFFGLYAHQADTYIVGTSLAGSASDVYKLVGPATVEKVCAIALEPDLAEMAANAIPSRYVRAAEDLKALISGIQGEEGDCGTGHFLGWRNWGMEKLLNTVAFRPWSIAYDEPRWRVPAAETAAGITADLELWSLSGLPEFAAFDRYKRQILLVTSAMADLFQSEYGMNPDEAHRRAKAILDLVVVESFAFSADHRPFAQDAEIEMRRAVLSNRPMDEIRRIRLDGNARDAITERAPAESILNVAVEYPEALKYLLESGFAADQPNAFGKTPLMYAVQRNREESVRLLLDYGADPNSGTVKPEDTCYYRLATVNVTPLHYAARYASPGVIRALVEAGAEPFILSENGNVFPHTRESPLDWLHRYTSDKPEEINANITAGDIPVLEGLLRLPSQQELGLKAQKLVLRGEANYRAGNVPDAYRAFRKALNIEPGNVRALNDLSLVALKNGNLGESLEASAKSVGLSETNSGRAAAWFNQGLACEKQASHEVGQVTYYNGNRYCDYGLLYPFLEAVKASGDESRKQKVVAVFTSDAVRSCQVAYKGHPARLNVQSGIHPAKKELVATFYVLHDGAVQFSTGDLTWDIEENNEKHTISPSLVETYVLGQVTVSEFASDDSHAVSYFRTPEAACESMQRSPGSARDPIP